MVLFLAGVAALAWAGGWLFAKFSWDRRLGYGFGVLMTFTVLGLAQEVTQAVWVILLAFCAPVYLGHRFGGNIGAGVGVLASILFLVACWRMQGSEPTPSASETVLTEAVDVGIEAVASVAESATD